MAKHISLREMYAELKEAGSTSDFPFLLGNVAHKKLLAAYRGVPSSWGKYALIGDLVDFKTHDRIIIGEAPDLLEYVQGAPAQAGNMPQDARYQLAAKTFGREWLLTRQAMINDDLNGFLRFSESYGRAAARKIAKTVVSLIEGNSLAYDGTALIAARGSIKNAVAGDLTPDNNGIAQLDSAYQLMLKQTDPKSGEKIGVTPWALLCGPDKVVTCQRLLHEGELRPINTVGGPVYNPFPSLLPGGVIMEPFLTIPNRVYMIANPAELPFVEIGFLNGKMDPDLLLKDSLAQRVMGGGDDPWGFDFDDMVWKIRHDWGVSPAYYQGIVAIGGGAA